MTTNTDGIKLPINMFDPTRDYQSHKEEYDQAIHKVLTHGLFIKGPEVKELEGKLSKYVGVDHCICVGNGTDALQIALLALDVGVGDEVITVAHTWISSAEVVSLVGATPVFVDIEDRLFCMDPELLEDKITDKTKAIIVVDLYGQTPDYDRINLVANKLNIPVIEDGAQSFGGSYKRRKTCGLATIGTTSFFPSKPLGCYGDGGACFTNDPVLADKMQAIANHGGTQRFHHRFIGMNSRLDTLQAAVLLVKFSRFEQSLVDRNRVADRYTQRLKHLEAEGVLTLPDTDFANTHAWAQYSILVRDKAIRDQLYDKLKGCSINVAIFYPAPLHTQECFLGRSRTDGGLPVTQRVCDTVINLPCYGELTVEEQDYVCETFENLVREMC